MSLPNSLPRFFFVWIACAAFLSQFAIAEEQLKYSGSYLITAELKTGKNGPIIEKVTIPAEAREDSDGWLHGSLLLSTKEAGRAWRVSFQTDYMAGNGYVWRVDVVDLRNSWTEIKVGTMKTQPVALFSVEGRMNREGALMVFNNSSVSLWLKLEKQLVDNDS